MFDHPHLPPAPRGTYVVEPLNSGECHLERNGAVPKGTVGVQYNRDRTRNFCELEVLAITKRNMIVPFRIPALRTSTKKEGLSVTGDRPGTVAVCFAF